MHGKYTFIADLVKEVSIPENGILSRTLYNDERSKVLVFGFAAGQELSAHTAPMPAILYFVQGEATVKLGTDLHEAGPGALVHMPPLLEHGIVAKTPVVMALIMLKQQG
ncbi:MAG: cupin domain-containing protein [Bryobacteraceae bacterium]|nr:cupin domain-containing protein [Bryobacteraceae bacterium]